jgi:thiol-disulfide isomerase/thioredoxin
MARRSVKIPQKEPEITGQGDVEKFDKLLSSLDNIQTKRKEESISAPVTLKPTTMILGIVLIVVVSGLLLSLGNLPFSNNSEPSEENIELEEGVLLDINLSEHLDFRIQLLSGSEVMLSDYIGQPIILDLFATWCQPCLTQINYLKEVQAQKPNVHILSISVDLSDTSELLSQYKSDHGMNWVVGRDITRKGTTKFEVTSIPTMAYINEQGIVRHWEQGVTSASTIISWINSG